MFKKINFYIYIIISFFLFVSKNIFLNKKLHSNRIPKQFLSKQRKHLRSNLFFEIPNEIIKQFLGCPKLRIDSIRLKYNRNPIQSLNL
jgi:hypothetical protein